MIDLFHMPNIYFDYGYMKLLFIFLKIRRSSPNNIPYDKHDINKQKRLRKTSAILRYIIPEAWSIKISSVTSTRSFEMTTEAIQVPPIKLSVREASNKQFVPVNPSSPPEVIIQRNLDTNHSKEKENSGTIGHLEYFIRVHYYLCIVPYRPSRSKNGVISLDRCLPQQIICAVFHLCAIISQVNFLVEALQQDLISTPVNAIELALAISDTMYVGFWVDGFWRKSTQLRNLIIKTSNSKILGKFKPGILYLINLSFSVLPLLFFVFLQIHQPERPDTGIKAIKPCTNSSTSEENIEKTFRDNSWNIPRQIISLPRIYIFQCVDTILLLTSVTSWDTASFLLKEARNVRNQEGQNVVSQSQPIEFQYKKEYVVISKSFKDYFTKLNDFFSSLYIAWFSMIVPWFSFRPLHTLGLQTFSLTLVHNWTLMVLYMAIWGFCSEAKRKTLLFKDLVEEDILEHGILNCDSQTNCVLRQIEHDVNNSGVKVGRFFQFSYECLGSVIGLVIAYALLFIQFSKAT